MKLFGAFFVLSLVCLTASHASAARIHFDAQGGAGGNTVNASNSSATDWVTAASSTTDNLWRERGPFGINNANVYENWGNGGGNGTEDGSPDLQTTVSGLTVGSTYRVWVDYIRFGATTPGAVGNRGGIEAGLALATNMTDFYVPSGDDSVVGGSALNGFSNADRRGVSGYLGTAVANGSGEINVYVGTNLLGIDRTWYDGVSYELVPEPSSLFLLGLGSIAAFTKRRR